MSIFNSLQFDDINSLDYGIYITGESVYNSPERDVEYVAVPGRNGDIIVDNGRWKNIEVTYHCGCFGNDQTQFASKIATFRNALASRLGYKRLTDTYNADEFRLGSFTMPIEADTVNRKKAGEFDVTFNCKPQRYLTSGEEAVTIQNGHNIYNPTLFSSYPLLEIEGSGYVTIQENNLSNSERTNFRIELVDQPVGEIELQRESYNYNYYDCSLVNSGDIITAHDSISGTLSFYLSTAGEQITGITCTRDTANISGVYSHKITQRDASHFDIAVSYQGDRTFVCGTGKNTQDTFTVTVLYENNGVAGTHTRTFTVSEDYSYTSSTKLSRIKMTALYNASNGIGIFNIETSIGRVTAVSSQSVLGNPTYIDCEAGQAYKVVGSNMISLNAFINVGAELPKLVKKLNMISYPNTITSFKIVPRWWKI